MGHGKETPRQKMIGMMYLVLTALLALNVSTSVLDAFQIIEEGLGKTHKTLKSKIDEVYKNFDYQEELNRAKVGPWKEKAVDVQKRAEELISNIHKLKVEVVLAAEGEGTTALEGDKIITENIAATTDYDTPNRIMIGPELNKNSKGRILKESINEYRDFLLSLVPEESTALRESIMSSLNTESEHSESKKSKDAEKMEWEYHKFGHSPLVGFLAIMSSLQIDISNAESEVVNYLYSQIDAGSIKFNKVEATVIPNSNYIIRGNDYAAQVFLAATDSTQDPVVWVTSASQPYDSALTDGIWLYKKKDGVQYDSIPIHNGRGLFKRTENSTGFRAWGGIIELQGPSGTITRPFKQSYQVAEGNVVVSPTKMNVFYLGVDNPVKVSVSNVPADKIFPTMTNGDISKKSGSEYIVRPKRPGNSMVTVFAEIDGKRRSMGTEEFRVKIVPTPVAKVAAKNGGSIDKNVLLAQLGVTAEMEEGFDFDLKFTVTEFTISTTVQGFVRDATAKGNRFTDEQRNIINNLGRGSRIYIQDIKAVGPDGSQRPLSTINFRIN
ncbi:MAG: gliding motility protein GldM [Bacteroidales bacterium]|nr:gliding motility protein GldM [Bacteroidales bacterium]